MPATRRSFIAGGAAALLAAPAIVRASSLMPLRGTVLRAPGTVLIEVIGAAGEVVQAWSTHPHADWAGPLAGHAGFVRITGDSGAALHHRSSVHSPWRGC